MTILHTVSDEAPTASPSLEGEQAPDVYTAEGASMTSSARRPGTSTSSASCSRSGKDVPAGRSSRLAGRAGPARSSSQPKIPRTASSGRRGARPLPGDSDSASRRRGSFSTSSRTQSSSAASPQRDQARKPAASRHRWSGLFGMERASLRALRRGLPRGGQARGTSEKTSPLRGGTSEGDKRLPTGGTSD